MARVLTIFSILIGLATAFLGWKTKEQAQVLQSNLSDAKSAQKSAEGRQKQAEKDRDEAKTRLEETEGTLKKAQDLLGRMHDLEVLIAHTRSVQGSSRAPSLKMSGELDRFVRKLENECRQLHGRYISMRTPLLTLCERVIDARSRRSASAA